MVFLGLIVTAVFYAVAPGIPGTQAFVQRYFCGHPLEYVSTTLFFVAASLLFGKLLRIPREQRSLKLAGRDLYPMSDQSLVDATHLLAFEQQHQSALAGTVLQSRIDDARQFVRSSGHSSLEEHLRYLADLGSDRLHQSFALLRTIAWAIPIVGFLGTVIGITIAIANVTPEQLESSLPEVTGGLAVAFDTTAQALGMSIVLVLSTFLVERGEQVVQNEVERFGIDCLVPALSGATPSRGRSEMIPGFELWSKEVIDRQTAAWDEQLRSLREGWDAVLRRQTESLQQALQADTDSALTSHRSEMESNRLEQRMELKAEADAFANRLDELFTRFGSRMETWQQAIQTSSISATAQTEELHRFGRVLLQLAESEERLQQLQHQLNQNLESLQIVDTLEQTLNGLNAAVHVLTAKTVQRSAA
jgi:biopolymer transport protein ExbB/TolQ